MLSRLTSIVVLALSVGVLLATVAEAGTFKGAFHARYTGVSIGGSLSFDGSTSSIAVLATGSGNTIFPMKPILGGASRIQGVSEVSTGATPCSFTGVFGEAESGVNTSLIGSVTAADGPLGSTFYSGASGSGCLSLTTFAFTFTETDTLFAGTGIYKNGIGSTTQTSVGFIMGPPAAAGAFGFFEWLRSDGKITITLP